MSFFLEEEVNVSFEFAYKELAEKIVEYCLDYAKFPYEAEVNLTLTDNEGIHEINREYRNVDRETDVISFAMEDNMDIKIIVKIIDGVFIINLSLENF